MSSPISPAIPSGNPPGTPLAMPAVLTHREAQACLQDWLAHMPASGEVHLEASGLQRFDSSALAVLLSLQRSARARGCRVLVHHLPSQARQLARAYGIESSLGLSASV
jgi:phospholipid transport system transporter-binding protein